MSSPPTPNAAMSRSVTSSGIASAVPATLVLFFVQDRLQAPREWEPAFLGLYFLCAALSIPAWLALVRRIGLARSWLAGMVLAIAGFVWTATLGAGDAGAFLVVCAATGVALGADLALPGAMLAGLIADAGDRGRREGAYFGWWNFATKLNLALAAGLALPVLGWFGYSPGSRDPQALQTLVAEGVECVVLEVPDLESRQASLQLPAGVPPVAGISDLRELAQQVDHAVAGGLQQALDAWQRELRRALPPGAHDALATAAQDVRSAAQDLSAEIRAEANRASEMRLFLAVLRTALLTKNIAAAYAKALVTLAAAPAVKGDPLATYMVAHLAHHAQCQGWSEQEFLRAELEECPLLPVTTAYQYADGVRQGIDQATHHSSVAQARQIFAPPPQHGPGAALAAAGTLSAWQVQRLNPEIGRAHV